MGLKKLAISQTPSLRKQLNQKANAEEQKVLCYVKALFNYDPKEDNIHPCAEIGLMFFMGDILAIVNQDDPNWWQARLAECSGPSGIIPSRELYGTKLDSVREVIDTGRMCVLDCSPAALKLLHNSNEFMPFVVFLAAPGLDEMKPLYDNGKMAGAIMASQRSLAEFERNSSLRHSSRRGRTLESLSSLYVEEDVVRNLEESAKLQRAY